MEDLPQRKNIRLKNYDYSQNGAYFVTICTQNKLHLFGDAVVGDGFLVPNIITRCGFPTPTDNIIVKLNDNGKIIERFIDDVPIKYEHTTVNKYVIMPNHIHMLLLISNDGAGNPSPTLGTIIGWFKYQTTKQINLSNNTAGLRIWQRSYYDHIIRNEYE